MSNYTKTEPSTIRALFDSIAPRYDLGNALMSGMLHKLWNNRLVSFACKSSPKNVLDLCSGTGEIACMMQKKLPAHYTLVDFSEEMLAIAQKRLPDAAIYQADVEQLPLQDASFDVATCAYGIRNVRNRDKAFSELYRVMKPGGSIAILELTRPKQKILSKLHALYLTTIVPLIGKLLTSNQDAYRYLCNSIHSFVAPELLVQELEKAGFTDIMVKPQTFGIATLFTAKKA